MPSRSDDERDSSKRGSSELNEPKRKRKKRKAPSESRSSPEKMPSRSDDERDSPKRESSELNEPKRKRKKRKAPSASHSSPEKMPSRSDDERDSSKRGSSELNEPKRKRKKRKAPRESRSSPEKMPSRSDEERDSPKRGSSELNEPKRKRKKRKAPSESRSSPEKMPFRSDNERDSPKRGSSELNEPKRKKKKRKSPSESRSSPEVSSCSESEAESDHGSVYDSRFRAPIGSGETFFEEEFSDESSEDEDLAAFHDEFFVRLAATTYATTQQKMNERAHELGLRFRVGTFTRTEISRLGKNVKRVARRLGIENPAMIFHSRHMLDNEKERHDFAKLLQRCRVNRAVLKSIFRPAPNILWCAQMIFNPFRGNTGTFTKEEAEHAQEFYRLNLQNKRRARTDLAHQIQRSTQCLNDHLKSISLVKGHWSTKESLRLAKLVKKYTNADDPNDMYRRIPFTEIAKHMRGRNGPQCFRHWRKVLCGTISGDSIVKRNKLRRKDTIKLIKLVYYQGMTERCDVDWNDVACHFENRTPDMLKQRFYALMYLNVANYRLIPFSDVCDQLYFVHRKKLKRDLKARCIEARSEVKR